MKFDINDNRYSDLFADFGGKVLGLKLLYEIQDKVASICTPNFDAIKVDKIHAINDEDLVNTINTNVVCKLSGIKDDFTSNSVRGLNTSLKNPRILCSAINLKKCIAENQNLKVEVVKDYQKAIILQNFVPDNRIFLITHSSENETAIEIKFKGKYSLLIGNESNFGHWETTLDYLGEKELLRSLNLKNLLKIITSIQSFFEFPINTEGFFIENKYHVIQLRETPDDIIIDKKFSKDIQDLKLNKENNEYSTYFCWGTFQFNDVLHKDNSLNNQFVIWDSNTPPWESDFFIKNPQTVFIRTDNGFHLSHAPEDLPHDLIIRGKYKYFYVPAFTLTTYFGRKIFVTCDGKSTVLL
jgi:hypothetical protein